MNGTFRENKEERVIKNRAEKLDMAKKKILITLFVAVAVFVGGVIWFGLDYRNQSCRLKGADCLPTPNAFAMILIWIGMVSFFMLTLTLFHNRQEANSGARANTTKMAIGYVIVGILSIVVSFYLMQFLILPVARGLFV